MRNIDMMINIYVHVQICSESQSFNVIAPIPWSKTYIHRINLIFISIHHFDISVWNSWTEPLYLEVFSIYKFNPSFGFTDSSQVLDPH